MTNNYLKVLLYLKQFEGDGRFHTVEEILGDIELSQKKAILKELETEQFIQLTGREERYMSFIAEKNLITGAAKVTASPFNDIIANTPPTPFSAKITFTGSKYLKEELQMQKSGVYNINISGDSAKHTVVLESNNVTIYNQDETKNKIDQIVNTITNDNSITEELKQTAIADFHQLQTESEAGKVSNTLIGKILSYGDQISSIGSMALSLAQMFLKP